MLSEDSLFLSSPDSVPTIVTREISPERPDAWAIDVYCESKPDKALLKNIAKLAPKTRSKPKVEKLGDEDWVTISQQGLKPLRAGRFYVHTSNAEPSAEIGVTNICVDASLAFGTGHHETTLGCLETLDGLKRNGKQFRNVIDVGTGTGLLAFAARYLWPTASIIASDIDPVAVDISHANANANGVTSIRFLQSNGLDSPAIQRGEPYDLIIANILARPLIALAPQISAAAAPGTILVLAGLLADQKREVLRAYVRSGFRLRRTRLENQWPCLTLIKARNFGRTRSRRRTRSPLAEDYFGEC